MKRKVLNMTKLRIILVAIVCFSMTGFARQTRQDVLTRGAIFHKGMTEAEMSKAVREWRDQRTQASQKRAREHIKLMLREAWKRELRISEQQWKLIEPKVDKVQVVGWRECVSAFGSTDSAGSFHCKRPSRDGGPMSGKTPDQMPEVYRIVEELIDLLEDENSRDAEIRKRIDALQQVREDARKELAKVGRELAPLLTTPRQEAIFLIMGYID